MTKNSIIIPDELVEKINKRVKTHFEEICKVVPRGSKKEAAMCVFIENFVKDLNKKGVKVEFKHQSETREGKPINNIVLIKPATKGYEKAKKVALQAHLDMVCQKTENSKHDFDKQPIEFEIKDNLMTSKDMETTLGADDGIGVACIMAILESAEIAHPEIQAVLTSDEEDGMSGAKWLDPALVTADYFINIDAETEGVLYYGCAGGIYANINIPVNFIGIPNDAVLYKIEISGLLGGHSGLKIGEGHANANRLMGRALNYLIKDFSKIGSEIMLADISGGDAKNAITKKAVAVVAVSSKLNERLKDKVKEIEGIFKYEYGSLETKLSVKVNECKDSYENVMSKDTLDKIVTVIMTVPNGVLDMYIGVKDLVETSSNLGVISLNGASVSLTCFVRSFIESKKLFVVEQIRLIAEKIGAGFIADTDFPEWNPNLSSPLLKLFEDTYAEIFGKSVISESVHAGLECGYFFKKFYNPETQTSVDLIAIGPTIDNAHVPTETLHLDTTGSIVKLLLSVLVKMKDEYRLTANVDHEHKRSASPMAHACNCMI